MVSIKDGLDKRERMIFLFSIMQSRIQVQCLGWDYGNKRINP